MNIYAVKMAVVAPIKKEPLSKKKRLLITAGAVGVGLIGGAVLGNRLYKNIASRRATDHFSKIWGSKFNV